MSITGFDGYQAFTRTTAIYPGCMEGRPEALLYTALGLTGEAGEVAEKLKKAIRKGSQEHPLEKLTPATVAYDDLRSDLVKELGDCMWYVARMADELGVTLADVVDANVEKLSSRKERKVLDGEGDDR